jgi:hypothetical protein
LAIGGFLLVVLITTFTIASFRANAVVPVSMMVAIRAGFAALFASQLIGALMIARGMTLVIRGNAHAAYATGGMLKPTHAVLMHGILVLPLIAWIASCADWKESRRLRVVLLAAFGYAMVVLAVAIGNVRHIDPSRLPFALTIPLMSGALLLVTAGATAIIAASRGRRAGIRHL